MRIDKYNLLVFANKTSGFDTKSKSSSSRKFGKQNQEEDRPKGQNKTLVKSNEYKL